MRRNDPLRFNDLETLRNLERIIAPDKGKTERIAYISNSINRLGLALSASLTSIQMRCVIREPRSHAMRGYHSMRGSQVPHLRAQEPVRQTYRRQPSIGRTETAARSGW